MECSNDRSKLFFSFDLQTCQATHLLQNGVAFYKISPKLYVWEKSIAGRGGQELASCVYHLYLMVVWKNMYSDSCSAQNRNI
ncbi:hypothetical protein PR048_015941 [Dryococelus australis]|uniref:Uncharacterized protein n=1 Tax=Dryococelus australis TaxID=614101 RepID=A0ABQ9HIC1_9NEOP|nr:hypothetical protein PR048_015941 [Dryococelus australis]